MKKELLYLKKIDAQIIDVNECEKYKGKKVEEKSNFIENNKRRFIAYIMFCIMLMYCVMDTSFYVLGGEQIEVPDIILEYCEKINEGKYLELAECVDSIDAEEYRLIFGNEENIKNSIGMMNVETISIVDICSTTDFDEFEKYYEKEIYINPQYYILKTEMTVKVERENDFENGYNYLAVVIACENGEQKIFDLYHLDNYQGETYFGKTNSRAANYDYSVTCSGSKWSTPTKIMVRISDGTVKEVNLYDYCVNVSANEFGYASWNTNAKKACAMAVKNYSWRLMIAPRKHAAYTYHVRNSDQVYNESVDSAKIDAVEEAVEAIWDYVMLDSEYGLFSAFYAAELDSSEDNHEAYARQYGGVLSQVGANSLGTSGMSWQNILHYYYDTNSSVEKYGNILPDGTIKIIDLNHTPVYGTTIYYDNSYHWRKCTVCNCYHIKTIHSLRESGGGYSICTGCRYTCVK